MPCQQAEQQAPRPQPALHRADYRDGFTQSTVTRRRSPRPAAAGAAAAAADGAGRALPTANDAERCMRQGAREACRLGERGVSNAVMFVELDEPSAVRSRMPHPEAAAARAACRAGTGGGRGAGRVETRDPGSNPAETIHSLTQVQDPAGPRTGPLHERRDELVRRVAVAHRSEVDARPSVHHHRVEIGPGRGALLLRDQVRGAAATAASSCACVDSSPAAATAASASPCVNTSAPFRRTRPRRSTSACSRSCRWRRPP